MAKVQIRAIMVYAYFTYEDPNKIGNVLGGGCLGISYLMEFSKFI